MIHIHYVTAMKLNNWDALTSETEVDINHLKYAMFTVDSFHFPPSLIRVIRIGSISVGRLNSNVTSRDIYLECHFHFLFLFVPTNSKRVWGSYSIPRPHEKQEGAGELCGNP